MGKPSTNIVYVRLDAHEDSIAVADSGRNGDVSCGFGSNTRVSHLGCSLIRMASSVDI
jgi:hypothetical protein